MSRSQPCPVIFHAFNLSRQLLHFASSMTCTRPQKAIVVRRLGRTPYFLITVSTCPIPFPIKWTIHCLLLVYLFKRTIENDINHDVGRHRACDSHPERRWLALQ